jgi:peroxiredoxin
MALSRKSAVSLGLTLLLGGVLVARVAPYLRVHNAEVGSRAPSFELTADDGSGARLEDYRGKYVLLNFWATWCAPCVEEMPALSRLHNDFSDEGLVVLGVSIDENREAYQRFLDDYDVSFPTVRDPTWDVMMRYGTKLVPETYLIGPDGIVLRKYVNWQNWDSPEIINYLRSLL